MDWDFKPEFIFTPAIVRTNNMGINQVKNRIHSIFKMHGICLNPTLLNSQKGMKAILNIKLDELSHYQVKLLINHLNIINEELNDLNNKIIINDINIILSKSSGIIRF